MPVRRLSRRDFLRLSAITTSSVALASCDIQWLSFAKDERPNFVIIETDDQRFDTMQYMPKTQELIFDQGVTFEHGYITTPLCGPSRSSIFTGMYAHTHGVTDNKADESVEPTFPEQLKKNGYYTGLVGKYSNTWKGEPRPEFDYWVSFKNGQHWYNSPRLNVNGEWIRHDGEYITYTFGNYVLEFIDKASIKRKPFCLCFTPNAPHEPAVPAAEDKDIELELPERLPSFNEEDISDKPNWVTEKNGILEGELLQGLDEFQRKQILTLFPVDRVVEQIMNKLKEEDLLDNTVVIFLSDNGKFWGEHRMITKNGPYEEAARVPFALRYPPLIPVPYVESTAVANIDIAPTFYDLAGIPIPEKVNGKSLVGLFTNEKDWREGILIEGWPGRGFYTAYHTGRYVYIETIGDKSEFYDLEKDPYQMNSAIDDPEYQQIIEHMKIKLDELKAKGDEIRQSSGSDDE